MKTIAVSIDEATLAALDRAVERGSARARGSRGAKRVRLTRSLLVRHALADFLEREERQEREARDRDVLARHRTGLGKQARALLSEQAEP